ncbi:hypothetical protein T4B_6912 [Trichinella pseudospiralis]|uniref:Uncharacterized protein n=1 Tax=Trichinella pseudospiralis TaxID=6337 RepID=A0A0V1JK98_TRIPS|nr:hypothetical protein T4B_6912 [Trichinella pseudospiralis]KRZ35400.1 hypothetical protein T4C_1448 [Trichinella pseudospiralis]
MNEKKHFMLKCLPNLIFDGINSVKQDSLVKMTKHNNFKVVVFALQHHHNNCWATIVNGSIKR